MRTSGTSCAVTTATTPRWRSAASVPTPMSRARASGLRTMRAWSWPGRSTSATKRPRPVTSSRSRARPTLEPTAVMLPAARARRERASRTTAATRSRRVLASIVRSETASQDAAATRAASSISSSSRAAATQDLGRLVQDPRHRLDRADHDPALRSPLRRLRPPTRTPADASAKSPERSANSRKRRVTNSADGWDSHGDDHLVRLERRRERPEQEVAHLDLAFPAARPRHDARIESERGDATARPPGPRAPGCRRAFHVCGSGACPMCPAASESRR